MDDHPIAQHCTNALVPMCWTMDAASQMCRVYETGTISRFDLGT